MSTLTFLAGCALLGLMIGSLVGAVVALVWRGRTGHTALHKGDKRL